ncbi:hypothetical protein TNCV_33361 [Trichonephila clavipes]|nr:hypothetical protein TNCV_33361 [Trichonephila clavipes]
MGSRISWQIWKREIVNPDIPDQGLDALAKLNPSTRSLRQELRCLPLGRKLGVKITCGDWYPPIWCRSKKKDIPVSGECTRFAMVKHQSAAH